MVFCWPLEMQHDEEFFVGDDVEESSSSDLELVVSKVPSKEEDGKQEEEPLAQNILEYDIESFGDKPWNKPGADITDYFNYGFNETTWKEYCNMQKRKNEFASGGSEWTEGKYSGVRRGFSEIKKDEDREVHRREKGRRREEKESGRRGGGDGQRWEGWASRKEERRGKQHGGEKEDGGRRHGHREGGRGR